MESFLRFLVSQGTDMIADLISLCSSFSIVFWLAMVETRVDTDFYCPPVLGADSSADSGNGVLPVSPQSFGFDPQIAVNVFLLSAVLC